MEHDRYVVVAGTTGISAVIAPDGREVARTEFFQPAYLDTQIRLKSTVTPATQWGPLVQFALVAAGLAAAVSGLVGSIRQNGGLMRPGRRRRQQPNREQPGPTTDPKEPHDQ